MKKKLLFLVCALFCLSATAQWINDPQVNTLLTPYDKELYGNETYTYANGNTYLQYMMPLHVSDTEVATCTFLQILKPDGKKIFEDKGLLISQFHTKSYTMVGQCMLVDRDGNAIIAVQDCRNDNSGTQMLSYAIYKISPEGEFLWGENGIDLDSGKSYSIQALMNMVQLEDGSYVLAWMREVTDGHATIQMQRLSADGALLWKDVALADYGVESFVNYHYPYLVSAGNNQVILVYARGTNQDIMARKIDFDGEPVWAQDARIYRGGFPAIPLHVIVSVCSDQEGGVFVGWYDDRLFTNIESAYVSHVKANGQLGFASGEEGEKLGYSGMRSFSPSLTYDLANKSLYAVWRETSTLQKYQAIRAQKLSLTGELKWDSNGIEVYPFSACPVGYISTENGKDGQLAVFFMVQDSIKVYGATKAHAALLNGNDGSMVWKDKYTDISTIESEKGGLQSAQLVNDQWITTWTDSRNSNKRPELYGQNVRLEGSIGPNNIETISMDTQRMQVMTDGNQVTFLANDATNQEVVLTIYTTQGQVVTVLKQQLTASGITWMGLNSGLYLATMNAGGKVYSAKFIIR